MIYDLIISLLAALLVAVLPGWFWAATLFEEAGRLERLVYSVGFSLALTPVVAYFPVRISGSGITLPVAVAAPAIVFVAGFLIHRHFGSPEKSEKKPPAPLFKLPARIPGTVPLILLIPSVLLMVMWSAGISSGTFVLISSGILIAASGVMHLTTPKPGSGKGESEAVSDVGREFGSGERWVRGAVLSVVFALVLVRGYIGPVLQDWPFVQGVDHYSHAVMANLLQSRGDIFPYLIYPPGFHAVTAMISQISGLRPLEIFTVLAPALFLLPALSVYVLGRRLWGWLYGALAALFTGVVASGPYIFYNDAMYPNLTTSEFLLVLAIAALIRLYSEPSWRSGLAIAILGSAPIFFHQVASLYTALTLALVALFVLPYFLLRDRRRGATLFGAFALLGVVAIIYGWDTYDFGSVIAEYVGGGAMSETGSAVGQALGTQLPYPPEDLFGIVLTAPVAWLGLIGCFFIFSGAANTVEGTRRTAATVAAAATMLSWTFVLGIGAATRFSGFPQRFAQDLALPLSLLAALAALTLARACIPLLSGLTSRFGGMLAPTLAVVILICPLGIGGYWIVRNLESDGGPSVRLSYAKTLTITPEIAAAGEWLRQNNSGGYIMVSPQSNQVPSRMMLAMGEYPGYQSFSYNQLVFQRDLPPGGAEPLVEVLQVVNFPETEISQGILRERDIRYVVLYKYMPDRSIAPFYERFEAAPELYETTFENSDVLIVRLRQ